MKKLLLSLLAISVIGLVQAQTPTPPYITTPTPGPLGAVASESGTMYHYVITLEKIKSFSGTTGDITLFTTSGQSPAIISAVIVGPSTAVTGGNISALTAQVQTANNNYGSAKDVHTASGNTIATSFTTTTPIEPKSTDVKLHLVSTGDNLSAATAGQIDVWLTRVPLR